MFLRLWCSVINGIACGGLARGSGVSVFLTAEVEVAPVRECAGIHSQTNQDDVSITVDDSVFH